jgi:serine/threonine-protein kinase
MVEATAGRIIGRYALFDVLAAGGMATVHIGRLLGPVGFARTVAIKRLHPQFARDPEFVSMFLDEARMCARIRHPNVVPTLDVVATQGELFLVMEYIQGESLAHLIRAANKSGQKMPWRVAISIAAGCLHGLHAAHEAKDERGLPLSLVHRDVSPQNVLVGVDGMARVVDFGIAKATGRLQTTREGAVKGKLGYMAPEQMANEQITRQADVYAAAVVLWECLTGRRLFDGESEAVVLARVLTGDVSPPSSLTSDLPRELDDIVMRGLDRNAEKRFPTARQLAHALEKLGPAALGEVGDWVESMAKSGLDERASRVAAVEEGSGVLTPVTAEVPPAESTKGATGGSIRPTARSEHDTLAPQAKKLPRWVAPAVVAGIATLSVGLWFGLRGGDGPPATASASSLNGGEPAPASPGPSAAPVAATATIDPAAAATASSAPVEAAGSAPPTTAATSTTTPAQKLTGKLPTAQPTGAKTGSPWSLGGRK